MARLARVDAGDVRLERLLQRYIHEWSALLPDLRPGADGRYAYTHSVDEAWLFLDDSDDPPADGADDGADDGAIGFAFTRRDERSGARVVEELFVVPRARRRGAGARAAQALFSAQPGPWTFTVRPENPGALAFWRRVVPAGASEAVEAGGDGVARTRFSFVWE